LGDWAADSDLGYLGGALVFGAAFALVGDFLDKPLENGGLNLSRPIASAVLLVFIVACIRIFKHKPATTSH
jgi:uncharacterized membrane-anchored protein